MSDIKEEESSMGGDVSSRLQRYPFCVVWTPIPLITWLFPFIGHMGIATSSGVIRDFAGDYCVSEDDMAFGWPTRYWQLQPSSVVGGAPAWDKAVDDASLEYSNHRHNLICDNCHSHVALALNKMAYRGCRSWNMITLCAIILVKGRFVGVSGFLKQWLPFAILTLAFVILVAIV